MSVVGEDTRARIVEAALATLWEEGIAGASARAIARRGGFNQALIFYHFGSVNQLLLAAVGELSARRAERYRERVKEARSLPELVAVAGELHREDSQQGHIAVLSQMLAGATTAPELKGPLRERFQPWVELVEDAIRRVVAGTPYAELVPTGDLAFVVTALFIGIELMTSLEDDPARQESLFRTIALMAALLEGLMGQGSEGGPAPPAPA